MKWFRLWTDILDDVKLLQLSDYEYRMFTYLLAYASEIDSTSGQLQITFKLLSLHFHQRFNLFSRAIETFQKVGLITVSEDGIITITNWNKRQFKSDNAYVRVKKYREVTSKRNVSCNVSETVPDTDTDTDKKKVNKEKVLQPEKIKFLDAVFLTLEEHQKLVNKYGSLITEKAIEILNNGIMAKGYKYKSHYHVVIGWPIREAKGDGNGSAGRTYGGARAPYAQTGRGKDDGTRGFGIPKEYKPESIPIISEEERRKNLERLKTIIGE